MKRNLVCLCFLGVKVPAGASYTSLINVGHCDQGWIDGAVQQIVQQSQSHGSAAGYNGCFATAANSHLVFIGVHVHMELAFAITDDTIQLNEIAATFQMMLNRRQYFNKVMFLPEKVEKV